MRILNFFLNLNYRLTKHLVVENSVDSDFKMLVHREVEKLRRGAVILECGGVSRPFLQKSDNFSYVGLDIDCNFSWENCYDVFICGSVEDHIALPVDLIFSRYLMEHVKDNKLSYFNQFSALRSGGVLIHTYPLGFHPFSIVNRILGNKLARAVIRILRKDSVSTTGYRAYYNLGCSYRLEDFLNNLSVDYSVKYYYDALDYFRFFYPFALIIRAFNTMAKTLRLTCFASNVVVLIRKT
jgi:hypothetical protein